MEMHRHRLIKRAALAAALMLTFAAPVLAAGPNASALGSSAAIASNPYGCVSRSDNPHFSTHVPGTVDAQAHTVCFYVMPRLFVGGTLSRRDCLLFVCWWTQVDQRSSTVTWSSSVHVNPASTCSGTSSHDFLLQTYSEATGADGVTYTGSSQSRATLACG